MKLFLLDETKHNKSLLCLRWGARGPWLEFLVATRGTLYNTAQMDAGFAQELSHAEMAPEYHLLRTVFDAAGSRQSMPQSGLERLYPDRYRPRKPGTFWSTRSGNSWRN